MEQSDQSALLILVAEDEREIRELIVFSLQIAGFRVLAVPNGQEAFNQAVAAAYFLKPFTPEELSRRLIKILTKYGKYRP